MIHSDAMVPAESVVLYGIVDERISSVSDSTKAKFGSLLGVIAELGWSVQRQHLCQKQATFASKTDPAYASAITGSRSRVIPPAPDLAKLEGSLLPAVTELEVDATGAQQIARVSIETTSIDAVDGEFEITVDGAVVGDPWKLLWAAAEVNDPRVEEIARYSSTVGLRTHMRLVDLFVIATCTNPENRGATTQVQLQRERSKLAHFTELLFEVTKDWP